MIPSPLILDFDHSVLPLEAGETRLDLSPWQERIRFGCSWSAFRALERFLSGRLPSSYGGVFLGSGDYHHLSLYLLKEGFGRAGGLPSRPAGVGEPENIPEQGPGTMVDLVVLDNHPDNMRYPLGLHCGSWISHAAGLPFIRKVYVAGITSADISFGHAWENRLGPLLTGKLHYWSVGRKASWLRFLGRSGQARAFRTSAELVDGLLDELAGSAAVYLSLDKDVFSPEVVRTNWDQGVFSLEDALRLLAAFRGRLAGMDVCGEVSEYTYNSRVKRLLSRLDGQHRLDPEEVPIWQKGQLEINKALLETLG